MVIVGLEKDDSGISSGGTLFFAERTGIELVLDDSDHIALHQFFSPNRGEGTNNSDFVVINGVANSPSHKQWEIVHTRSLRPSIRDFRTAIDSIEAGAAPLAPAEPPVLSSPRWEGGQFSFDVQGTSGRAGVVEFSEDGIAWKVLDELSFGDEPIQVLDAISDVSGHRLYRVLSVE